MSEARAVIIKLDFLVFMAFDDYKFRPITFQGITFPATLMGISILEPVLGITDEDIAEWLWRFPICCGVTKSASADRCARCAQRVVDLMLEQRQRVLNGIQARLALYGFEAESTYRDWLLALQRIVELSKMTSGECFWSAPLHLDDKYKTVADSNRLMEVLDRARSDLYKTGNT